MEHTPERYSRRQVMNAAMRYEENWDVDGDTRIDPLAKASVEYILFDGHEEIGCVPDPERAAFIVRAVNSHEALVEALENAVLDIESMESKFMTTNEKSWVRRRARKYRAVVKSAQAQAREE